MSHVDEGTLHAYLDGALDALPAAEAERVRRHLAVCDVCAARVEEERLVRDEATAILAGAPLDVGDLPNFEEVRARARATPATSGFRLQRLTWAATVVLALGTGWLLRGGIPQPSGRTSALGESRVSADRSVAANEAKAVEAAEAESAGDEVMGGWAEEDAFRDAPAPAPSAESESAESGSVQVGSVQAPAAQAPSGEGAVTRETVAAGGAEPRDARRGRADTGSGAGSAPASGRDTVVASDDAAKPQELWAAARQSRERTSQSIAASSPTVSDAVAHRAKEPLREEAGQVVAPVASAIPRRVDALEPAGASLVVPGLSVVSVAWLEQADLAGAIRVLQLMEGGDTLELVHLPAGVDPSLLPAVGDGRTQVLSPRDGGWLVARARASADVLSALLRRLEGGGP